MWRLFVVLFSLSLGWSLCGSLQGGMALCVGNNVYLAIKQQLFRSHSVCQVQRRARFQGSVDRNGSECIYLRVLTPLTSASRHQHQLKQTFDLWASRAAEQSPLFPQDVAPLQAGVLVYMVCASRMHYGSLQGSHFWSQAEFTPQNVIGIWVHRVPAGSCMPGGVKPNAKPPCLKNLVSQASVDT